MSKVFTAIVIIAVIALVVVAGVIPGLLVGNGSAINALTTQGFSHIHQIDRNPWFPEILGCGHNDVVQFTFSAVNPAGHHVQVHVCEGIFKGATIRGT